MSTSTLHDDPPRIPCHRCGRTSPHPHDVQHHACAASVIHWVKGLAPGHTPICGAEDGMGSILPQLVTCPACTTRLERTPHAPDR